MNNSELHNRISNIYSLVFEYCQKNPVSDHLRNISSQWHHDKLWKIHLEIIQRYQYNFIGKTVLDYGCKYGHMAPLFFCLGAEKVIGIDVEEDYIHQGRLLFSHFYQNIEYVRSQGSMIDIQSETVDYTLINEVISHINDSLLERVYSEITRVLVTDGVVVISDGNNVAYQPCADSLPPLWEAWELGPDGAQTSRDVVVKSYLSRRREIIEKKFPDLNPELIHELALQTSGLWGSLLVDTINKYISMGRITSRYYRRGTYPTNPADSGIVMERGFYPIQVILSLKFHGIDAWQLDMNSSEPLGCRPREFVRRTIINLIAKMRFRLFAALCPKHLRMFIHLPKPSSYNFTIVGKKLG